MSNISPDDALLASYEELKMKSANKYMRFTLVAKDAAKKDWAYDMVEQAEPDSDVSKNEALWNEMLSKLPEDAAQFVVFDFCVTKDDGRMLQKLVLVKWCPDTAPLRQKMVVGSSFETLKSRFVGIGHNVQATDSDDLSYESILKALA